MNAALMERFRRLCGEKHDISEHLGILRGLACDPDVRTIVEIGFRTGISATALASAGKVLVCYDIEPCTAAVRKLRAIAPKFRFEQMDSLKARIPACDLLHIDSLHTYKHLRQELSIHGDDSRKWIALHDTDTFAYKGKDGTTPGLMAAVGEFLDARRQTWKLHLQLTNNNGLTLLRRII